MIPGGGCHELRMGETKLTQKLKMFITVRSTVLLMCVALLICARRGAVAVLPLKPNGKAYSIQQVPRINLTFVSGGLHSLVVGAGKSWDQLERSVSYLDIHPYIT